MFTSVVAGKLTVAFGPPSKVLLLTVNTKILKRVDVVRFPATKNGDSVRLTIIVRLSKSGLNGAVMLT